MNEYEYEMGSISQAIRTEKVDSSQAQVIPCRIITQALRKDESFSRNEIFQRNSKLELVRSGRCVRESC